jgi:5-methylcytosine-specific restriction endonuclease McrA
MNNCIDCKKELKSLKAKRCTPCENKRRFKLEIMNHKGEHHPRFKGGLPHCIDCDKKLSNYNVKRCRKCAGIQHGLKTQGQNHYGYIDGRTNKKYFCIDCKKEVHNIYAKRCLECLGKFNVGNNNPNFGNGNKIKGINNPNWRGGITPLADLIRHSEFYSNWIKQIFERDNYICQECGQHGGNLESHHIKPFSKILKEFLNFYNQFSPLEDIETLVRLSESYSDFLDINNGKTLCEKCHNETKLGEKINA